MCLIVQRRKGLASNIPRLSVLSVILIGWSHKLTILPLRERDSTFLNLNKSKPTPELRAVSLALILWWGGVSARTRTCMCVWLCVLRSVLAKTMCCQEEGKETERQKANAHLYSTPCPPIELWWSDYRTLLTTFLHSRSRGPGDIHSEETWRQKIRPLCPWWDNSRAGKATEVMSWSLGIIRGALRAEKLKDVVRY